METLKIFTGNAHPELANNVALLLGTKLGDVLVCKFADGEVRVEFNDPGLRDSDLFIIQPTQPPDAFATELRLMIRAVRHSAARITAVVPYFGYARQDRRHTPHVPISVVDAVTNLVHTGLDRVILIDLHVQQIVGIFEGVNPDIHVDHLYARPVLLEWFGNQDLSNAIICSVDTGGSKWVESYWDRIAQKIIFGIGYKRRSKEADIVDEIRILGDVEGRDVYFVDDMVSTGGSLVMATDDVLRRGATSVTFIAIHPVIANVAVAYKIANSGITRFVTTDTLPISDAVREILSGKLEVVTVAPLIAGVIRNLHFRESVGGFFELPTYLEQVRKLQGLDRRQTAPMTR